MEFIRERCLIIPITKDIAENAVDFSLERRLSIIDSLIYTTAILNEATLITLDNDFRGLESAVVF